MNPAEILATEFCDRFIELMRNRMVTSFYKYGPVRKAFLKVDQIASLKARLAKYEEDGNTEWLVDAANFAMIEFMQPAHPKAHFTGTDSDASPGRVDRSGKLTQRNNGVI